MSDLSHVADGLTGLLREFRRSHSRRKVNVHAPLECFNCSGVDRVREIGTDIAKLIIVREPFQRFGEAPV